MEYEVTDQQTVRFWSHVHKNGDCWMWRSKPNHSGYGMFALGIAGGTKRYEYAHRIAYRLTFGTIPDGYHIHHACPRIAECPQHRLCVNPSMLVCLTGGDHSRLEHTGRRRPQCKQGHPLTDDNIKIVGRSRICLTCDTVKRNNRREQTEALRLYHRQTSFPEARIRRSHPLTPRDWDIIKRWINGELQAAIARHYGLSRERVRKILAKSGYREHVSTPNTIAS